MLLPSATLVTDLFTKPYLFTREPYMPRGHKKDIPATKAEEYRDGDSFMGLDGHEYLKGQDWKDRQLEVLLRDNFTCRICDTKEPPFDVHHIIPRGSGGSEDRDNLMLLCRPCHNAMHPEKQTRWTGGQHDNAT